MALVFYFPVGYYGAQSFSLSHNTILSNLRSLIDCDIVSQSEILRKLKELNIFDQVKIKKMNDVSLIKKCYERNFIIKLINNKKLDDVLLELGVIL